MSRAGGRPTPAPCVVRAASLPDADLLHELAAATFPLACPAHTTDAAKQAFIAEHLSQAKFLDYLGDDRRDILIAEWTGSPAEASRAIAWSMLVDRPSDDPDVTSSLTREHPIELSKFYVRAEQHGRGIAGMLMAATLDAARHRGAQSAWLGVNQENERANRFYEKHQFHRVGTKRFLVGGVYEDDFVRERLL